MISSLELFNRLHSAETLSRYAQRRPEQQQHPNTASAATSTTPTTSSTKALVRRAATVRRISPFAPSAAASHGIFEASGRADQAIHDRLRVRVRQVAQTFCCRTLTLFVGLFLALGKGAWPIDIDKD